MKTNIKMRVTPEQSKKVQEIVSANGGSFLVKGLFIFVWISYCVGNMEIFKESDFEEVDADLFIRTNGTCEEEPQARTFSTKKEAIDAMYKYAFQLQNHDVCMDEEKFTFEQIVDAIWERN